MRTRATDNIIEEIISNADGHEPDARKRHVFRQTLYSLVRLARAEQLLEMRRDVAQATGKTAGGSRHQARLLLREIAQEAEQGAHPSEPGAEIEPDSASLPCPGPGCPDADGGPVG